METITKTIRGSGGWEDRDRVFRAWERKRDWTIARSSRRPQLLP